jgi:hypothetical protein
MEKGECQFRQSDLFPPDAYRFQEIPLYAGSGRAACSANASHPVTDAPPISMVVFLGFLDRFGLENPQFDITQVRNFALKKRDERISHFIARINQLNLFWRKSPVVRFPWRQPVTSQVMEKLEEIEDE